MDENDNQDNKQKKYSFKLLRDEAVDTDAFEDNTHEKVANSILQLIENEKNGLTIGLEGPWGSGKSTVISILNKKLKEKAHLASLIQFDAWAHEGDPLRQRAGDRDRDPRRQPIVRSAPSPQRPAQRASPRNRRDRGLDL